MREQGVPYTGTDPLCPAFTARTASNPFVYCFHAGDQERMAEALTALKGAVDVAAVGVDLFFERGHEALGAVREAGLPAYAHLLYYDVAEMVANGARALAEAGWDMLDTHAFMGEPAIARVCEEVQKAGRRLAPTVIACTMLPTQLDMPWAARGGEQAARTLSCELARNALRAGVTGVLVPPGFAADVAPLMPEGGILLEYAQRYLPLEGRDWGLFFDPHLDPFWGTEAGWERIRRLGGGR